jgi:hypothetical protein
VTLFEEYSLFVEDTSRLSDRRQTISNIYIAVNSILLAGAGLLIKDLGVEFSWKVLLSLPLIIAGIAVCHLWIQLIERYKSFIGARLDILRATEDLMQDSIRMYHQESERYPHVLNSPISDIESNLPKMFICLYILFCIFVVVFYLF